jgi:hypothetical protein
MTDQEKIEEVRKVLHSARRMWTPEGVASQATEMLNKIAEIVGYP